MNIVISEQGNPIYYFFRHTTNIQVKYLWYYAENRYRLKLYYTTVSFVIIFAGIVIAGCNSKGNGAEPIVTNTLTASTDNIIAEMITDSNAVSTFFQNHPLFSFHSNEIFTFYANRNYRFGWFDSTGLTQPAVNFINILNHFSDEGLRDSVIYISEINAALNTIVDPGYQFSGKSELTEKLDIFLTAEFFVYAQKVWGGISENATKDLNWYVRRKTIPVASLLDSILQGNASAFSTYQPLFKQYDLLKAELKKYKNLSQTAIWDSLFLPPGKKFLEQGDNDPTMIAIKQRLYLLGDLPAFDSLPLFDSLTDIAVKKFQQRFGLKSDGHAGPKFFEAMNIPIGERIAQIELNMERCRWVPVDLQGDYVIVNIPEFKAHIYAADTLSWTMQVIVGRTSTSTTIFNDEIEYIVFSPYWYVPGSIIRNEIFPAMLKNADYLERNHYEVFEYSTRKAIPFNSIDLNTYTSNNFPYGIRQKPGAFNSLGWVKFMLPNAYDIYLHDTPSRNLFAETQRNFSHGCIRIGEPLKFAEFLLRNDSSWTTHKIDSVMHCGVETKVNIPEKVPVLILYFTAWVDENGQLNFRNDIYGHDKKMRESLSQLTANNE